MNEHSSLKHRPLVLVGGGGHCRSVIDAALSAGIPVRGILDLPGLVGTECLGVPVIGSDGDMSLYADGCDFVVTLGFITDSSRRVRLHRLIAEAGGRLATVVASTARVSPFARLAPGTVVLHHASVNAGAEIGQGVIVNTGAIVEHDAVVGDYCHVSTAAIVNGGCRVGHRCFLGSRSVLANGVTVASDCIVGAGSVVVRELSAPGVYHGVPARLKR